MRAELKLVVKDVKKKLTYEGVEDSEMDSARGSKRFGRGQGCIEDLKDVAMQRDG
jgi:hypothetical protein